MVILILIVRMIEAIIVAMIIIDGGYDFDNDDGDDFGKELMTTIDTCTLHPVWNILHATSEWRSSVLRAWTKTFAPPDFLDSGGKWPPPQHPPSQLTGIHHGRHHVDRASHRPEIKMLHSQRSKGLQMSWKSNLQNSIPLIFVGILLNLPEAPPPLLNSMKIVWWFPSFLELLARFSNGLPFKSRKHLDRNILTNRPKFSRVSKTAVYWLDDAIKPNGWSFQSSDGESRASDLLWHGSYGHSKCFTLGLRAKLCHPLCKGFVLS